jgi:ketosteroid isomerase-like protein
MRATSLFLLLPLLSCQVGETELGVEERRDITAAVLSLANGWIDGFRALDAEMVVDLVDEDDFVFVTGDQSFSAAETSVMLQDLSSSLASWEGGWDSTRVEVLSEDGALFHGSYHVRAVSTDGMSEAYAAVPLTALCRRINGVWKMTLIHQSYGEPEVEGAG